MRRDPVFMAVDVSCASAAEARALQDRVRRETAPDAAVWDEIVSSEGRSRVPHRIGDYFEEVMIQPGPGENSFRLIFHRRRDAGRFWKDVMVYLVRAIEKSEPPASVAFAYRCDEYPAEPAG
jgi:hypothetical protein